MVDDRNHSACVDAWLTRVAKDLPPDQWINVFEDGFSALWLRARQPLGEVTLSAIADRVLFTATEQFPLLATLKIESTGLRVEELRKNAASQHHDHLAAGIRFVLVEFLRVIGNLTGEILTPSLHAALSQVVPEARGTDPQQSGSEGGRDATS